jgi:hypothetical protein
MLFIAMLTYMVRDIKQGGLDEKTDWANGNEPNSKEDSFIGIAELQQIQRR